MFLEKDNANMLANKVKTSQGKLTVLAYFPVTEDLILLLDKASDVAAPGVLVGRAGASMVNPAVPDSFLQDLTLCFPVALL